MYVTVGNGHDMIVIIFSDGNTSQFHFDGQKCSPLLLALLAIVLLEHHFGYLYVYPESTTLTMLMKERYHV